MAKVKIVQSTIERIYECDEHGLTIGDQCECEKKEIGSIESKQDTE